VYRIVLENVTKCCKSYPAELLEALLRTAEENGVRMYLVGGTVRDCLLGRISHDLDIAVSGRVLPCAEYLQRELGGGTLVDLSGPDDEAVRLRVQAVLDERGKLTNAEVRRISGYNRIEAIRLMRKIMADGHAKLEGRGRGAHYLALKKRRDK